MGDAYTRPFLEDSEMGLISTKEIRYISARNTFLFCLYRFLQDPTAGEKKNAVFARAKMFTTENSAYQNLENETKQIIPMLVHGEGLAWLRLLVWVGRFDNMYLQFKDMSPFANMEIYRVGNDYLLKDFFPVITKLWDAEHDDDVGTTMLVLPKNVNLLAFNV